MKYVSSILSSSLGNILEWYDFGLFTIFSSLFSRIFFPKEDPHAAFIATVIIFAIGFFCRPLGALIFGYWGDTCGRAITLRLSILMVALPTFLIGCIPNYQHIGIGAPIFLMIIRMWQGISIGGEYSGNLIYLAETAPVSYRATITSFASMGANSGILLAALAGIITNHTMSASSLESWGWRIPYLSSGILCLILYFFRLQIHETMVFEHLKMRNRLSDNPIKTVFKNNFPHLLRTFGLVCMGSTFYYFCYIYIPIFLTQSLHFSLYTISTLISCLLIFMIMFVPLAGYICDKVGRRKMLLFNAVSITVLVVPGFYLLQQYNINLLLLVLILFTIASSLEQATTSVAVVENFPLPARYTGVSLSYNMGNGFLGGTVPIICEWLATQTSFALAPAMYIAFCAAITGMVVFFFIPETRGETFL